MRGMRKWLRSWKARHDEGLCKKCVRWAVGILFIFAGVAFGFVPLIPGFVFILIGLVILGFDVEKRIWKKTKEKIKRSRQRRRHSRQ